MESTPREYQKAILETAKGHNTLIVIPTGMGKTLIAFLLAKHYLEKYPKGKVLVLAPTRPLVEQHMKYFEKNLPELYAELQMFTGKVDSENRKELWQLANIIFSTPQCIANDLKKRKIDLSEVSLLVEDEAHRCLKNYDYTYIAKKFLETRHTVSQPRIIGMTASPGSDNETINNICQNLNIEKIEARHRDSEDVKHYIEKLEYEVEKVELSKEIEKIRDNIKKIYASKIEELKNRKLLFSSGNKKTLLDLQGRLGARLRAGEKHFNNLRGISVCAQAIKIGHALELVETQGISQTHKYFKAIIDDSNKGKSKAAKQIANNPLFMEAFTGLTKHIGDINHPKMERLRQIVEKEMKNNPKSRFIIFGQFRDTVIEINKMVNGIKGIKSRVFVGQMKKDDTGLSQKEQQQVLNEFRFKEINVLTATSVAEEGLDIEEVNNVIFYEPLPSAIRTIQRRGRTARLKPGKLIILLTKKTKDEVNYWTSLRREKKMYKILGDIKRKLENSEGNSQKTLF